jgi:ERF superfamily protein
VSALGKALLAFQKEAPSLHKDSTAEIQTKTGGKFTYRYLGLDKAMEKIRPVLTKHGLVLIQMPWITESGKSALKTTLMHGETGESISSMMLLPGAEDPQGQGSEITYARRYSVMAILALVGDEDDDAVSVQPKQAQPEIPAEERPSNPQHRKLAAVLKELESVSPANPDVPKSGWEWVARDWIEREFNKRSRTQLTRQEMGLLIDHMEQRLEDEKVPIA